ncbi:MAG: cation transporter [Mailhella sp.]|nr:cation transporter [Mailhella sp.]
MPVVKIQGMRCPHCKSSVEKTLEAVPNAGNVIVRLEKGKAEWDGPALA